MGLNTPDFLLVTPEKLFFYPRKTLSLLSARAHYARAGGKSYQKVIKNYPDKKGTGF